MRILDQVMMQAELLTGELDGPGRELLRLLCSAAVSTLQFQLKADITPEQCREEFVTAASLYALAELYRGKGNTQFQEFRAGDLTVKRGTGAARSPESLKAQALELLRPNLKDSFRFLGV